MDEKKIYNAIVRVDDDLIDRSLTRKPKKKTKASIILSGSCIAIVACMVLSLHQVPTVFQLKEYLVTERLMMQIQTGFLIREFIFMKVREKHI